MKSNDVIMPPALAPRQTGEQGLGSKTFLPPSGESPRNARWSKARKMKTSLGKTRLRQAVGSFDDAAGLHDILQVLADQDVPLADLTVLVGRAALDDRLVPYQQTSPGTVLDHVLASMSTIGMTKGAGPLLVSSTPFSDFLIGAGDTVETSEPFLAHWLSAPHAGYLQQQLDAGAALLCIHVRNGEEEKRAGRALLQHSRHQVQMHDFSFP